MLARRGLQQTGTPAGRGGVHIRLRESSDAVLYAAVIYQSSLSLG